MNAPTAEPEPEDCGPDGLYCPSELAAEGYYDEPAPQEQLSDEDCALDEDCLRARIREENAEVAAEKRAYEREHPAPSATTSRGSVPHCKTGKPCGRSCIARDKRCHK